MYLGSCINMKRLSKYLFYFLAFLLPFGSINPLDLTAVADVENRMDEQLGFTPILFALCCVLALFDGTIYKHQRKIKLFLWPLGILLTSLAIASVLYKGQIISFPSTYLIKLFAVEIGFYVMALYFIEYQVTLRKSMLIYAYTCVAIILAFFGGFLNNYSYVSNGRLWIFGENPNSFSFLMGLGTIILTNKFNQIGKESNIVKVFDIISICLLLLYIVLSGSRGSFLIVSICMVILLFNKRLLHKAHITIPIFIIVIFSGYYYYDAHQDEISIFNRMSNISSDERGELQSQSLELFFEQPLLGYGVNGYKEQMLIRHYETRDSHNVLITTAAMSGVIGGFALSVFLILLLHMSWKNRVFDWLGFVICVNVFLMSMKTGGVLTFAMMWYSYAIVVALSTNKAKIK